MKIPNNERQRKWKEKQAEVGKKAVTVMLTTRTKVLIDRERKRTGETIAGVIERAVENLFGVVTSNKRWFDLPPDSLNSKQKAIVKEVNQQRYGLGFEPHVIADIQNKGNKPTLTGASEWDEGEVQQILDYLDGYKYLSVNLRLLNQWKWDSEVDKGDTSE